jgi:drug/metabolite transporter (DMT)-like permease
MNAPRGRVIAAFAAIYLIWGSTYLFMRFAVETVPPLAMSGFRFLTAGLLLYALTRWRMRAVMSPKLPPGSWPHHAIVGILLTAGNATISWAVTRVPSGVVSLFVAMTPCWMVLFDWLRRGGRRPAVGVIAGVVLGVAGTMLLIGPPSLGGERVDPLGAGVSLVGTLSWAAGSIYSRGIPKAHSSFHSSAVQLVFGGAAVLLFAILSGSLAEFEWSAISTRSALSLVYLVLAGSLVAFSAYMYLLSVTTPALVSTYAFVNPVVAVLLGVAFAGEHVSGRIAAAGAVIVAAVVLITMFSSAAFRRRRSRTETLPVPVREAP